MYYDWDGVFSRQANGNGRFAMVLGARSIGKTFGLRLRCIQDNIKRGKRYIELVRNASELEDSGSIRDGYFGRIQELGFYKNWLFKVDGNKGYIARDEGNDKPQWQELMRFVALSKFQRMKKGTFSRIGRIVLDEFVIDRRDRYAHYLRDEYGLLAEMISTITREDNSNADAKVYLLGNAVDFAGCPYFEALGIDEVPSFGFHWYKNKTVLLHYVSPDEYKLEQDQTLAYKLLDGTAEHRTMFANEFLRTNSDYIAQKTKDARYAYSISFLGRVISVWIDYKGGSVYITDKAPKGKDNMVYALTTEDNRINYLMVRRTSTVIKSLVDLYYQGYVYYETMGVREHFQAVMNFLGVR